LDGPDRQSLELALHIARANALGPLKGFSAPETVATLTEAKRLLDAGIGTDPQRFFVLYGLCPANYIAARLESALALARQMVEVADRQDDPIYSLVGYRLLATTQLYMGQNRKALETLQHAERYRDPSREELVSYRFGYDPGLGVLVWKINAMNMLGLHFRAAQVSEQVMALLPSRKHAATVAACTYLARVMPAFWLGDFEACERRCAEVIAYCIEKKVETFRLVAATISACARASREPTMENIAAIRDAIDANHRAGFRMEESAFKTCLAAACLAAGDVAGAETTIKDAFSFVEQTGERYRLAELHRVAGQIALNCPEPDHSRAEACFLKAVGTARSQEARVYELRAATDLARLWRDTGSSNDPRALLEPILAAIEGGEGLRDVRAARAVLAEIV
jgi:tetratricopeptide (TPR) repeat protein